MNSNHVGDTSTELLSKFLKVINTVDLIKILQNDLNDELLKYQIRKEDMIMIDRLKVPRSLYIVAICHHLNNLILIHGWGIAQEYDTLYVYNTYYWLKVEPSKIKKFLSMAAQLMGYYSPADAETTQFQDAVYKQFLISANPPDRHKLKSHILINLRNGTFDVKLGKLREHKAEDFFTYCLTYEYNPSATFPQFTQYLNRVLPEISTQRVLQEFHGYVFMHLKLEKALILYGKGSNGKSVQFEITRALFGQNNVSTKSLGDLVDMDMGNDARAKLKDKLVNFGSEIRGNIMDVDIFKRLVSGEPVAARERYKTSFDLENNCKFIFNANKLPRVGELTEAYFRRFLIIPYNQFISDEEKDPELHLKIIENELPGVLNWAIEGLNRLLQKKQFSYSKVVEESIMEYKKESNSIIHFIDESSLKMSLTNRIPISSLFDKYMQFCRFNDLKSFTKIDFSKTLKSLNFDDYRTSKERGFYAIFEN